MEKAESKMNKKQARKESWHNFWLFFKNAKLSWFWIIVSTVFTIIYYRLVTKIPGSAAEYFINWAKVWRIKARPEYQQLLLSIDVHAPNVLRTNMPPRNFKEWYETFHVTAGNGMYIAPSKRLVIW